MRADLLEPLLAQGPAAGSKMVEDLEGAQLGLLLTRSLNGEDELHLGGRRRRKAEGDGWLEERGHGWRS